MNYGKKFLVFVITSVFLASGLAVGTSAGFLSANVPEEKSSVSQACAAQGTESSGYLTGSDPVSALGNLYGTSCRASSCPEDAAADSASVNQSSSNTHSSITQVSSSKADSCTAAAVSSQASAQDCTAPKAAAAAETAASGKTTSCNSAGKQSCTASSATGNDLMSSVYDLAKKNGIDLSTACIQLPGCGTAQPQPSSKTGGSASSGTTAASGSSNSSQAASSGQNSTAENQTAGNLSLEEQVVALVNEQRAANVLKPLTLSTELSNVARTKSQDMHDNHYFAHESPTYGSPFDMLTSFGISYRAAGENIAMGYATPEAVMNAWMNSSGHRANILSASYTKIGVGYVADGNYWTQEFIG